MVSKNLDRFKTHPQTQQCAHRPIYTHYLKEIFKSQLYSLREQLWDIVLKAIHKYRSYGLEKSRQALACTHICTYTQKLAQQKQR